MFFTGSAGWQASYTTELQDPPLFDHFRTNPHPQTHSGKAINSSWPMLMHPFNILCFYMECWQWTTEMEGTFCWATSPTLNLSSQRSYALQTPTREAARVLKEKWKHRQIQMHPCWKECSFHTSSSVHICHVAFPRTKRCSNEQKQVIC